MQVVESDVAASEELLQLVDETGRPTGTAPRRVCHGRPELLHAVVHVVVVHPDGRVLLQRRSAAKDIAPDCWDTAVGGHLDPGETPLAAARRETAEELGRDDVVLTPLYTWIWRDDVESEFVHTFGAVDAGPWTPDPGEIAAVRYWTPAEFAAAAGSGLLNRNCEVEWQNYMNHRKGHTP